MNCAADDYHLAELRVAQDPSDPGHILPPIDASHRRILDVGCGAGQTLLARPLPAGVLAVGVDPSLPALTLGRSLRRQMPLVCSPGETLPFADGVFDFVYARVALPYMHTRRALSEMGRVLRPGGLVWLTLHSWTVAAADVMAEAKRLHLRAVVHGAYVIANGLALHALGREFAWPFGTRGHESFQTSRGISRALRRAGFTGIAIENSRFLVARARRL